MSNNNTLLIFDVNETLLDLKPIENGINQALGSGLAFGYWFSKMLQFSSIESLTGRYRDFGEVGAAALKMMAQKVSVEISEEGIQEILGKMTNLSSHPEVPEALTRLKEAGYKLVTLTNGGQSTLEKQLKNAALDHYFDATYSVEAVRKFKPHPAAYRYVLEHENTDPQKAMLIAAHAWDIIGAQRAGLQTGFVSRPGKFLYPPGDQPKLKGNSLTELTDNLLAL